MTVCRGVSDEAFEEVGWTELRSERSQGHAVHFASLVYLLISELVNGLTMSRMDIPRVMGMAGSRNGRGKVLGR